MIVYVVSHLVENCHIGNYCPSPNLFQTEEEGWNYILTEIKCIHREGETCLTTYGKSMAVVENMDGKYKDTYYLNACSL